MITRSPVRPHVCLQCQRNLSKRLVPSKLQSSSFHQSISISNSDEQTPPAEPPRFKIHRVPAQDRCRTSIPSRNSTSRNDGAHQGKSRDQPGNDVAIRLHGHRGRKLQENLEDLKTNSLGDAAKVIVLQDSKFNFYTHLNRMKDQAAKHVDIESVIMKEMGIVDPQEVNKTIDGLKKGPAPQTWEELNGTVQILSEGFTYAQLMRYLDFVSARAEKNSPTQEQLDTAKPASYPSRHISNVTVWMPGVSDFSDHFEEDPLRGYYMPSHTAKQKLALKVIRECWQWELPEVSEGLGQFEVQMSRTDLDLLSKGPNSPLTLLHGEYLAHEDEAMEIFPSRGTIRVTTMRHKLQIVVDLLARDLDLIQREPIFLGALFQKTRKSRDFEMWQAETFSDSVLQELSQITSTEISRISKNTLLVSCFLDADKPYLSSRVDTVKRLLTTTSGAADHVKHSLESNSFAEGMFIQYPQVNGLDWRGKMREWVRWTAPFTKSKDVKIESGKTILEDENTEHEVQSTTSCVTKSTESWLGDCKEVSALFGSIIHTSKVPGRDLISPFDSSVNVDRGFSTLVPNLSRFLQTASSSDVADMSPPIHTPLKYITLRFVPDPFQSPWAGSPQQTPIKGNDVIQHMGTDMLTHLPHMEMYFSVAENNLVNLKNVLAIIEESKSDVMLPSNGIDIRFQARTTRRMKNAEEIEALQAFVATSIFDLRRGRMLTPPTLNLPVGPEMLSTASRQALNLGTEPRHVQYMFAGLDVSSTLVFNWKEWRILYTSIEAGQAGGRRGELKLQPLHGGRVASKQDFIQAANELAHELGDTLPNAELTFGSLAAKGKPTKDSHTDADTIAEDAMVVSAFGADQNRVKDVKWSSSPALFGKSMNKDWFANQTSCDEPWKTDDADSNAHPGANPN